MEIERLELASRMLGEAKKCIEKGDGVQASEKLYKASEEALKMLTARFKLPEYEEAERKGRWSAVLLDRAARRLSEVINPEIKNFWLHAWFLHVEGSHEARLKLEDIKVRVKYVDELINFVEEKGGKND